MIAVYRRVSTEEQNSDAQGGEIERYLDREFPGQPYRIFEDHGISGTKIERPGLSALEAACEGGEVSHVVVYKLDRLTRRGAGEAVRIIHRLDGLGIRFTSVTEPHFSHGNPMRMTMVAMMGDVAHIERNNLVERVQAGIAAAKARGVKFGAPKKYTSNDARTVARLRADGYSYREIQAKTGISKSTAQRLLTKTA